MYMVRNIYVLRKARESILSESKIDFPREWKSQKPSRSQFERIRHRGTRVRVYCGIPGRQTKERRSGLPVTDRWGPQVPDLVSSAQAPLSHPSQPTFCPPSARSAPLKHSLCFVVLPSPLRLISLCALQCFSRSDCSTSHVSLPCIPVRIPPRMRCAYRRPRAQSCVTHEPR